MRDNGLSPKNVWSNP